MNEDNEECCHDFTAIDAVFCSMYTTQRLHRHLALVAGCSFLALPQVYASALVQSGADLESAPATSGSIPPSPPSAIDFNFFRRATSTIAHDKYLLPAIVTMVVILLVALLCCFILVRGSHNRPIVPPIAGERQPQPVRPPLPFLPSQAGSVSPSESVSTRSWRRSKVQRKTPPAFQPSPAQTPPATATRPNSYVNQPTHPTPGVPQHPSLAVYNPEPLNLTQSVPMSVTRTAPTPETGSKGYWTQEGPRMSTLSAGSAGQSSTQIGSGASENALSYVSYVSRTGHPNQAQGPGQANGFAIPSQDPPSPPVLLPPVQRRQDRYSHRRSKSASSSEYRRAMEDTNGSEKGGRKSSDSAGAALQSSSQPPQYSDVKGFMG